MNNIPAECQECGHVYTFVGATMSNVTLESSGGLATCPKCGGRALVQKAKIEVRDGVATLTGVRDKATFERLNAILAATIKREITPEQALERIKAADTSGTVSQLLARPEWQGVSGITGIVALILTVVTLYLALTKADSLSCSAVQEGFDRIVAQLQSGETTQEKLLVQINETIAEANRASANDAQPKSKRALRRHRGKQKEVERRKGPPS